MRTDRKYQIIGGLAGAGLGATVSIAYQKAKLEEKGQELTWDSLNGWQLLLWATIGALLGGKARDFLYKFKAFSEENPTFSSGVFLNALLKNESIKSDPARFNVVVKYREEIKSTLYSLFYKKLADSPVDAGSFKNRTAIASDYDVDLILPFRKTAFSSLASMHSYVYKKLVKAFDGKASVEKNRRTIGITFSHNAQEVHFDIAPGREIRSFKKDGLLNMYVSADWAWGNDSSQKINVNKQQKLTVNNPQARDVIRLLKLYSLRNGLNIPPVIITQVTVKALSPTMFGTEYSKHENLLNAMNYLADKLNSNCIQDLSNSNNNLLNKMIHTDRYKAIDLLTSDIEKIEAQPSYVEEAFRE